MTKDDHENQTGPGWDFARALNAFGEAEDASGVEELRPAFAAAEDALIERERLEVLVAVIGAVESQQIRRDSLLPFLLFDSSTSVISTAALHSVPVWPGVSEETPLRGLEDLLSLADIVLKYGDEERAVAIVSGMLMLGDRRVTEALRGVQRRFSTAGRGQLAGLNGVAAYAPVIDWLIDWLEDCERDEFGSVAGALSRFAAQAKKDGVIETSRALPIWARPLEEASVHVAEWTFEEFAERIRPRLLRIAADEAKPRVMHEVLDEWGLYHARRWLSGIYRSVPVSERPARDLLPLVPPNLGVERALAPVPLEDDDFLYRNGNILAGWGIFNPYGPTFNCIGRIPTEDPTVDLLFYRMLNPFSQESCAIAALRGDDRYSVTKIDEAMAPLFARNFVDDSVQTFPLIGGLPSFVFTLDSGVSLRSTVPTWFLQSPAIAGQNVMAAVKLIRDHPTLPWDRAMAELKAAAAKLAPGAPPVAPSEGTPSEEDIGEWWMLVTYPNVVFAELQALPAAWHGAIDQVAKEAMGRTAYTFWQLDDFAARYGFTLFRDLAEPLH